MKSLLNELEAAADKIAYQTYTIQHGIELIKVLVPLKNSLVFETEFHAAENKNKDALLEVVIRHSGKIRGA